jgi:hypothetical protein
LAAASICLPVEANGPVMGRIRPILKASWAAAAPARAQAAVTSAARSRVVGVMRVSLLLLSSGGTARETRRCPGQLGFWARPAALAKRRAV